MNAQYWIVFENLVLEAARLGSNLGFTAYQQLLCLRQVNFSVPQFPYLWNGE